MTKTINSNLQKTNLLKTYLPLLTVSHPKFILIESTPEVLEAPLKPTSERRKVCSVGKNTILKTVKMEIKWTPENINNGMLQYLQDASNLYNESWNKGVNLTLKLSKPEFKKR